MWGVSRRGRGPAARRLLRGAALLLGLALLVDLALWTGHVLWRPRAMRDLEPLVVQLDSLEARIREDDAWLDRNERLLQGYARHAEYAERLALRGRRLRAHEALAREHDRRVRSIYRRFYLAPLPPPEAPLRGPTPPP